VAKSGKGQGGSGLQGRDTKELLAILEKMQLIRSFEEKAGQMYGLRKIGGFCHLYNGQEAVAVGAIGALDLRRDYVLTGYRDHGHALACGMEPGPIMAELYGKVTGCSRGKGGSMHLFDAGRHFLGGNGIVGAQLPVAAGVAFAQAYRGRAAGGDRPEGVTLCFFGDGAIHQGAFHESLNLARIWKLPTIFIVENNQWGMGTNWRRVSSQEEFHTMAKAYDMPGDYVDGMDVLAVKDEVSRAVARAREDGMPSLIEARTYRYKGHSMSDPQKYRSRDEVDEYRKNDPILLLKDRLAAAGLVTEAEWEAMNARVDAIVEASVAFAEEGAEPAAPELYADVYADAYAAGGVKWRS
jgi:pyruvate dehydrogenase E1 component alpha subunit